MSDMHRFRIDPTTETAVQVGRLPWIRWRYAYSRSADSRSAGETGQDYLSFASDKDYFVFAICDGVSQSFYGELAAGFLGDSLIDWLCAERQRQDFETCAGLSAWLADIEKSATELVAKLQFPSDTPSIHRAVLEEKRTLGSETTFVCGRLDLPSAQLPAGQLFLAWSGDSRIRLWGADRELNVLPAESFRTEQRWSTRQGLVGGAVHCYVGALVTIQRLVAYSDGLAVLDGSNVSLSSRGLNELIAAQLASATSDDIAFLELVLPRARAELDGKMGLPTPQRINVKASQEQLMVDWQAVPEASSYQLMMVYGETGLNTFQTFEPVWRDKRSLEAGTLRVRVRALNGNRVSAWSKWSKLKAAESPLVVSVDETRRQSYRALPRLHRGPLVRTMIALLMILSMFVILVQAIPVAKDWITSATEPTVPSIMSIPSSTPIAATLPAFTAPLTPPAASLTNTLLPPLATLTPPAASPTNTLLPPLATLTPSVGSTVDMFPGLFATWIATEDIVASQTALSGATSSASPSATVALTITLTPVMPVPVSPTLAPTLPVGVTPGASSDFPDKR